VRLRIEAGNAGGGGSGEELVRVIERLIQIMGYL
jgi:hypothetical protein